MSADGLVVAASGAAVCAPPVAAGVDEDLRAASPDAGPEPAPRGLDGEDRQTAGGDCPGPREDVIVVGREVQVGFHAVMGAQERSRGRRLQKAVERSADRFDVIGLERRPQHGGPLTQLLGLRLG